MYKPYGKEMRCTNLMEGVQTLWKGNKVYKPYGKEMRCTNLVEGVQTLWKGI